MVSVFDLQTLAFNSRDDVLECLPMVTESGICDGQQFLEARLDQQVPLDSQRQPPELGGIATVMVQQKLTLMSIRPMS